MLVKRVIFLLDKLECLKKLQKHLDELNNFRFYFDYTLQQLSTAIHNNTKHTKS